MSHLGTLIIGEGYGHEVELEQPLIGSPEWGAPHNIRSRYSDIANGTHRLRDLLNRFADAEINKSGRLEISLYDGHRSWPCVTHPLNRDRLKSLATEMRTWREQVNTPPECRASSIGMNSMGEGPVMSVNQDGWAVLLLVFNPMERDGRWGVTV